ncbi:hypothetical protein DTO166G4_272 [Paecilomyces variotii]|nr:hypothetical protein DTO166G4_272 [Paecilomyces variotii]KAJ9241125.1 hypothetical protein DTO166G5_1287 [Paecilomyces variotii]KAJ9308063.1 hypothetical protein DTO217A2_2557 [Paecilomyces variotii]
MAAYAAAPALANDSGLNQTILNEIDTSDPLFHICWRRQSCGSCLTGDVPCSWCPFSSTCVPNPSRIPIFSPFQSRNVCPLGSKERWEIRTTSFGCNVSALNFLSVLVAVISTLAVVGLMFLLVWIGKKVARQWTEKRAKGITVLEWVRSSDWRIWRPQRWIRRDNERHEEAVANDGDLEQSGERRPLLG